jgi:hypothetical protein
MVVKKRRKKKKYKTGVHHSPKCATPIEYRSGWEKEVCIFLDNDPNVVEYGYECVTIQYVSNTRTGKIRTYFPDFLVTYKDGTKKLIEVKRQDKLADPKVLKKAKAAEKWAEKENVAYEFWTNTMIFAIKKLNSLGQPPKPRKRRIKRVSTPKPRKPRKRS